MASTSFAQVDDVSVFYREVGNADAPVVLLLHGFPSSSHQYRNLIPKLATEYRVIAPDLPGYGFTELPAGFEYTFANFADVINKFLNVINVTTFSMYVFDYGAPTGFRLALKRPQDVTAIISQNGNAYQEGLESFWDPIKKYQKSGLQEDRMALANLVSLEATKWQYTEGAKHPEELAPEAWWLDYSLMLRPGNHDVQLDLLYDYQNNVAQYPQYHEYFRNSQVPKLAVWGKNDQIFVAPGAQAFKKDRPDAEVHLIDAGHFALESNLDEISGLMLDFLRRKVMKSGHVTQLAA